MVSTSKIVALVALVLLSVCGVALAVSAVVTHTETRTTTVPRHVDRVVVEADAGRLRLEGGDGNRVVLRQELRWVWSRPHVRTRLSDSTLIISGTCPSDGPTNRCRADLSLEIPFDADVEVTGDAGDIVADRLAGHIELATAAGDVTARDLNPISVRATTDAGDIDLRFSTEPVSVTAFSDAGDVSISTPGGGEYRVDAVTDDGNVDVSGILRNDRALRSISATTHAGDVRVIGRR